MHTIGKTAERAGRSADTLRYYEKAGLITPDRRTASGYRLYGSEALRRLPVRRPAWPTVNVQ